MNSPFWPYYRNSSLLNGKRQKETDNFFLVPVFAGFTEPSDYNFAQNHILWTVAENIGLNNTILEIICKRSLPIKTGNYCILGLSLLLTVTAWADIKRPKALPFVGQDLHLTSEQVITDRLTSGEHVLVFENGLSMNIGANHFVCDRAVVWLQEVEAEFRGRIRIDYTLRAYLEGGVSVKKGTGAHTIGLTEIVLEQDTMAISFLVDGEVFITADKREQVNTTGLPIYKKGIAAIQNLSAEPDFVVQDKALVPAWPPVAEPKPPVKEKAKPKRKPVKKIAVKPAEKTCPKSRTQRTKI